MNDLSIVLPISDKDGNRRNIDRAKLLFKSINYFWKTGQKFDFFIVTPDDELEQVRDALISEVNSQQYNLHFMNETAVHPSISAAPPGYGIACHMLIKLAAPSFIKTKFYMIFDTDIVACKPMDESSFIQNGKALSEYWIYSKNYPWFLNSAKVLHIPEDSIDFSKPRLFVTPSILSTDIVVGLQERLSELADGRHWIDYLLSEFNQDANQYWTEYTLYDLYADSVGLKDTFHLGPYQQKPLHCMEQGIWSANDFKKWDPEKALDGRSPGYFMVLQSITGADVSFDDVQKIFNDAWTKTFNERLV